MDALPMTATIEEVVERLKYLLAHREKLSHKDKTKLYNLVEQAKYLLATK